MAVVGTVLLQNLDVAALSVLVPVLCVVIALGVSAFRRRQQELRRLRPRGVRTRLDVIRRDLDRPAEYFGGLPQSEPAVWQPFEHGLAAMAACQWDQAIEHFRKAQAKANGAQLVPLYNQTGVCRYIQGRPDDALRYFEESARLAKQHGDEPGKAPSLGNIGVVRHDYGELDRALVQLSEALAIARSYGDRRAAAPYLGSIGNIHRDKGELDKALKFHEDALAISREAGDRCGTARCLGNIGSIYRYLGELDKALTFHYESLALAREVGHQVGAATELGNIGLILTNKGTYEQAVPRLAESLTIFLAIGVAHGPRQARFGLSKCDDGLGRKRMQELLKEAGLVDGSIADLLDRIDQMRRRRPW